MQSSTKVIIFFKKAIYIDIFLHIFAFHFHHNEKNATQATCSDSEFIYFNVSSINFYQLLYY